MTTDKTTKPIMLLSGSLSVDQIMTFDGAYKDLIQPDKLHVLSISTLLTSLRRTYGGVGGNIAYALALLGESAIIYGSLNRDDMEYVKKLKLLGVDVSYIHYSSLPTSMFNVLTDRDGCQVGGFYVGAMADAASLTISRFKDSDVFVVISPNDPKQMVYQIHECDKLHKRLFFDPGQQIPALSKEELIKGIDAAELLVVNDYEFGMIMKKCRLTKREILERLDSCVVTLGAYGADVYDKQNRWRKTHIQAVSVQKVLDPTGAGDAFRGGFLYGYIRDWEKETCVRLGCVVASFVVETQGTQEYTCAWKDIKKRYKETYKEEVFV